MASRDDIDVQIREGINHLKRVDKKLAAVIKQTGPLYHKSNRTRFEALARTIVGQQLSGKAAATIFGRFRALLPGKRVTIQAVRGVSDKALRTAGLSAAKVIAVRDLCDKIDSGQLKLRSFHRMSDDEVSENVVRVKGLGPWSAQMYLMFVLRRLDVFAEGDLGIRHAINRLYGVDHQKRDIAKFARRWKPYRTIACWYLWASLNNRP